MKLLKFRALLLTYWVCTFLIPLSESAGPISPGLQHTQTPLQNFITAVRWNARKVLGIPEMGFQKGVNINNILASPQFNSLQPDLIRQALSSHQNVGNLNTQGSAPLPNTELLNHPVFPFAPSQQNGWSPHGHPTYPPQQQFHDFAKGFGWSPEPVKSPYLHDYAKGVGWNNDEDQSPILKDMAQHLHELTNKGLGWTSQLALRLHDYANGLGLKADQDKSPYLNEEADSHEPEKTPPLHYFAKGPGWNNEPEKLPYLDDHTKGLGWNSVPEKFPYFQNYANGFSWNPEPGMIPHLNDHAKGLGWNPEPAKIPQLNDHVKGLGWNPEPAKIPHLNDYAKGLGWNPESGQISYLNYYAKGLGWNHEPGNIPHLNGYTKGFGLNDKLEKFPDSSQQALHSHDFANGQGKNVESEKSLCFYMKPYHQQGWAGSQKMCA